MSSILSIAYIANIRLPTEKAHGYQIMKMCEALADEGAHIVLTCPIRRQTNSVIQEAADPFDYYGIRRIFTVRYIANFDIFRIERYIPAGFFKFFFYIHSVVWGAYALYMVRKTSDAVYLHDDIPLGMLATFFKIPLIYEVHGIPAGVGRLTVRFACGSSTLLVGALTAHIRDRLIGEFGYDFAKTVILPDGVDLGLFSESHPRSYFRKKAGFLARGPLVGYVGTFTSLGYEKGVGSLIRAMALVREKYPDATLVCVGGPDELIPQYERLVAHSGIPKHAVCFTGHVNSSGAVLRMRACDVLVIPLPYNEFFAYHTSPLKLFEYMASRVPIVASDLPSLREVISERTTVFAEPGNAASLAAGICCVLDDPRAAEERAEVAYTDVLSYAWRERAKVVMGYIS